MTSPPTGVYAVTGGLEIRLSEDVISGSDLAYIAGYIIKGGISQLKESADLRRGGDIAAMQGVNIQLRNAEQLFLTLKTAGVTVQGCPVEIHEFEWDATAYPTPSEPGGSLTNTLMFTGIVDDVQWDALGLTLKLKNSRLRRNAFIGTIIDNGNYTNAGQIIADIQNGNQLGNFPFADDNENGKIVPCTFGEFAFDGTTGAPAKLIRTASAVVPLVMNGNADSLTTVLSLPGDTTRYRYAYGSAPGYGDVKDFPVYGPVSGAANIVDYYIKIGSGGSWQKSTDGGINWISYGQTGFNTTGAIALTALAGMYLTAIDGVQSGNGRLIASAYFDPSGALGTTAGGSSDAGVIKVTIADSNYFTKDNGDQESLQGNYKTIPNDPTITRTGNDTWVQLQAKHQDYAADIWPGEGWL